MQYLFKDIDDQSGNDACKLIDAWEVQTDESRVNAALKVLQGQANLFATVVRHYQIRHGLNND